jgi:hypothetical protein
LLDVGRLCVALFDIDNVDGAVPDRTASLTDETTVANPLLSDFDSVALLSSLPEVAVTEFLVVALEFGSVAMEAAVVTTVDSTSPPPCGDVEAVEIDVSVDSCGGKGATEPSAVLESVFIESIPRNPFEAVLENSRPKTRMCCSNSWECF